MFKDIKLPFNMSILELLTIATFVAIGYSVLYKYAFYSTLNINWYLFSLQPNYILFSSIKFIFFILFGSMAGSLYLKPLVKNGKLLVIFSIPLFISFLLVIYVPAQLLEPIGRINIVVFVLGVCISALILIFLEMREYSNVNQYFKYYMLLVLALSILYLIVSIPSRLGKSEALNLTKLYENINIVNLKENKEEWILIELNGDKALIMNKKDHKVFKLVEYKDIDTIRVE